MVKFLIIGDSCVDKFIYGECDRICPEAPVPVFNPTRKTENGGMAENVKANIESLDVSCDIITNTQMITKTRYVDNKTNQMLLRVDEDDYCDRIDSGIITDIDVEKYDAIIISDYCKGFLNEDDIEYICNLSDNVFLNTKKKITSKFLGARFIQLNQYEYEESKKEINYMIDKIKDKLIITYGDKGCYYKDELYPPPRKVEARDLSGAGDTFISAFSVSMVKNNDVNKSIDFAQECACDVVTKRGVVTI
mgnify:CR=1 FL=1